MIVCKYDNFIENIFRNETIDLKKKINKLECHMFTVSPMLEIGHIKGSVQILFMGLPYTVWGTKCAFHCLCQLTYP